MQISKIEEQKIKCALDVTDIIGLCYCVNGWLYDLKSNLEESGMFQKEIKRGTNRAIKTAGHVIDAIYDNMKVYNPNFASPYTQMSEELLSAVDDHIYLQGIDRCMNLIITACYLIYRKTINIESLSFYFDHLQCVKNMPKITSYLSVIKHEEHSLLPIFEQQLSKMYKKYEKYRTRK